MSIFGKRKKEEKTPELPPLPALPELPKMRENLNDIPQEKNKNSILPAFPNSHFGEKMSQNTIKEAVEYDSKPHYKMPSSNHLPLPPPTNKFNQKNPPQKQKAELIEDDDEPRTLEVSNWTEHQNPTDQYPSQFKTRAMETTKDIKMPTSRVKRTEPLFVKLEKYEGALSTFNEIKLRVSEMDSMLKNIKEVKKQEEEEIDEWEKEIEMIKSRLDQIDKDLFNKV